MSEKTKNVIERFVIPALLAVALIAVTLWAVRQRAQAEEYKATTEALYRRAYGDLADDLYEMETNLSKLMAVNSPAQYVLLLDEVWRLSGSAVSSMSHLPVSHVDTTELNQFVVRLGDYAHALTQRALRGSVITQEDSQVIAQLRNSCSTLAGEYREKFETGDIPIEKIDGEGYYAEGGEYKSAEGINAFPTLIYDGPFSESSEKLEPKGLTGGSVSAQEAEAVAEAIAGCDMQSTGMTEGKIRAFDFSMADDKGNWAEASVTEQGGSLLWYMSSCQGNKEGKPAQGEAERYRDAALKKLAQLGYEGMTATYAQYYGGTALINCAATQEGVILYNDLVKVWVDRETLDVCGIDARNYLFSHTQRELVEPALSTEEAEAMLSGSLEVQSRALALIPLTPQSECLCHEFKCKLGEDSYIVYINAETGAEEQVFRIIDSEDGQLVI